jgi:enoyl-CoA hydratase/carnithine racemase
MTRPDLDRWLPASTRQLATDLRDALGAHPVRTAVAASPLSRWAPAERSASARPNGAAASELRGSALAWKQVGTTLEVELYREPCNEIGTTLLRELELLADFVAAGAGGARALLFYSSVKRGFSAGADLRELEAGLARHRAHRFGKAASAFGLRAFIERIHRTFDTLDQAPLTTIAAVHGFCFGGGFELALTADVIVADKSARFCFPELRLGIVPGFGGIPRLRRELGNAVIRDLLLTGRSLGASRAHSVGLVSQLTARGQALDVARRVAEQAARFDAETTARAKAFAKPLPREELQRERELFYEMVRSDTTANALRRFTERSDAQPYLP